MSVSALQLLKHVTIASGGVIPRIHPELLVRKKGGKIVLPTSKTTKVTPTVTTTTLIKTSSKKTKAAAPAVTKGKAPVKKAAKGKAATVCSLEATVLTLLSDSILNLYK